MSERLEGHQIVTYGVDDQQREVSGDLLPRKREFRERLASAMMDRMYAEGRDDERHAPYPDYFDRDVQALARALDSVLGPVDE